MRGTRSTMLTACVMVSSFVLPCTARSASSTTMPTTAPSKVGEIMPSDGLPLEPFERGVGRDLLGQPVSITDFGGSAAWYFGHRKSLAIEAPSDQFEPIALAPEIAPGDRFDLRVQCRVGPSDGPRGDFARLATVGLYDRNDPRPDGIADTGMPGGFLGVALWVDARTVTVYHGDRDGREAAAIDARGVPMDRSRAVSIRLVRDGKRDEVFVDGRRIYSAAAGPVVRSPAIYLKTVGARVYHTQVDLTEPPPPTPTAATTRPSE